MGTGSFSWLVGGLGASIALVAVVRPPAVWAKSSVEVNRIAQAITVKIVRSDGSHGSGILLQQQGETYTVLTAAHVVEKDNANVTLTAPDDQRYNVPATAIRISQGDVDMAILQFRSRIQYQLAQLGDSNQLEGGMELYVAGFPAPTEVITESVLMFRRGQVTANSKRTFRDGYALIYDNTTLPGMSGGPVLDSEGKVVGIHGKGDRELESRKKTGFNAGIPIAKLADLAPALGLNIQVTKSSPAGSTTTADDYFVSAYQKDQQGDFRQALTDYNRALELNPRLAMAYNNRGWIKHDKLQDAAGALDDYNRALDISPRLALTYNNRGWLKQDKYKDIQGALADYNRAIEYNPEMSLAYSNRGWLKQDYLKDIQGALADYNRAIAINPSLGLAYNNRGWLRQDRFQDYSAALADYSQAIAVEPTLAIAYGNRGWLRYAHLDNYHGALEDFDRAVQLDPQDPLNYNNRALVKYYKLNNRPGAITDMRRAHQLALAQNNTRVLGFTRHNFREWGLSE